MLQSVLVILTATAASLVLAGQVGLLWSRAKGVESGGDDIACRCRKGPVVRGVTRGGAGWFRVERDAADGAGSSWMVWNDARWAWGEQSGAGRCRLVLVEWMVYAGMEWRIKWRLTQRRYDDVYHVSHQSSTLGSSLPKFPQLLHHINNIKANILSIIFCFEIKIFLLENVNTLFNKQFYLVCYTDKLFFKKNRATFWKMDFDNWIPNPTFGTRGARRSEIT